MATSPVRAHLSAKRLNNRNINLPGDVTPLTDKLGRSNYLAARLRSGEGAKIDPLKRVDDVIVITETAVDQDNLVGILKTAFGRASELATQQHLVAPLQVTLSDAETRCLLTMTMDCDESGWTGRTESGDLDTRGGIAFPWLLVLEDAAGRKLRIRLELGPQSRVM